MLEATAILARLDAIMREVAELRAASFKQHLVIGKHQTTNLGVRSSNLFGRASSWALTLHQTGSVLVSAMCPQKACTCWPHANDHRVSSLVVGRDHFPSLSSRADHAHCDRSHRRGGVRLFTRNGHDWTGRFPLIATVLAVIANRLCLDLWLKRCRSALFERKPAVMLTVLGHAVHPYLQRIVENVDLARNTAQALANMRQADQGAGLTVCDQEASSRR